MNNFYTVISIVVVLFGFFSVALDSYKLFVFFAFSCVLLLAAVLLDVVDYIQDKTNKTKH